MEPNKALENADPSELLEEAGEEYFQEQKSRAKGLIKKQLQRQDGIETEIRKLEKELVKKKEQRAKTFAVIKKIKEGDWSAIQDIQN